MTHLACIGHLNLEDTQYPDRPLVRRQPGGAGLYAAAAARLWGGAVTLVSRIGEDYPQSYLDEVEASGIDCQCLHRVVGPTMAGRTQYQPDGSRHYAMYTPAARRLELTPHPADWPVEALHSVQAAHLATMPPALQMAWLEFLRPRVALISLDTDTSFAYAARDVLMACLSLVDIFMPSQAEVAALFPDCSVSIGIAQLRASGPRCMVIKYGAEGAYMWAAGMTDIRHIAAAPAQAVDVTGAGDAFCGGFLAGFLETGDFVAAGERGTVTAALAIEDFGALHLLRRPRSEAEARLRVFTGESQ
jgi:ribokinase